MALDYAKVKNWPFPELAQAYGEKDTMLYALSLGLGSAPLDENRLKFIYEKHLQALPTMAVILGYPGFWLRSPETGVDWVRAVQGAQALTLHRPLPPAGQVGARTRVTHVIDKGPGKGAVILSERELWDRESGQPLATLTQTTYCRGDGGYSRGGQPSDPPPSLPPALPDAPPDRVEEIATRPDAALLYRLLADRNPLHAEPAVAREAGYPRPILHGLVGFGLAGFAIMGAYGSYDPARIRSLQARFSAPVFPGETLRVETWRRDERVFFRVRCVERDVVVLTHGLAEIRLGR